MSDARQGDTVVVRKSSQSTAKETEQLRLLPLLLLPPCCCSPCCCCCCCSLGCCYTQIARGNWQPLKESMQVAAAAAAVGCCLLVVASCWLTSIEARWMLSWEFAVQFDVTSNAQLATCNGQLGAAPELTLPPSKSARSWQYSHWAALRKISCGKLDLIIELNLNASVLFAQCIVPFYSFAACARLPCFANWL